jgi:hypothetical protein
MLFSERRYDFHGACGPLFGMISTLQIANSGPRNSFLAPYQHIAFQKKT